MVSLYDSASMSALLIITLCNYHVSILCQPALKSYKLRSWPSLISPNLHCCDVNISSSTIQPTFIHQWGVYLPSYPFPRSSPSTSSSYIWKRNLAGNHHQQLIHLSPCHQMSSCFSPSTHQVSGLQVQDLLLRLSIKWNNKHEVWVSFTNASCLFSPHKI